MIDVDERRHCFLKVAVMQVGDDALCHIDGWLHQTDFGPVDETKIAVLAKHKHVGRVKVAVCEREACRLEVFVRVRPARVAECCVDELFEARIETKVGRVGRAHQALLPVAAHELQRADVREFAVQRAGALLHALEPRVLHQRLVAPELRVHFGNVTKQLFHVAPAQRFVGTAAAENLIAHHFVERHGVWQSIQILHHQHKLAARKRTVGVQRQFDEIRLLHFFAER
mmetsp:Transcript_15643/g.26897  ORF Transcript_15643/g.26897 Transcript_15643/m.26897 type:complete len:227 (+) Transcript_15643:210-890(+)